MSIKTFWTIFLKILGIWLILDLITNAPQSVSIILASFKYGKIENYLTLIAWLLFELGIYVLIFRLFIFNTNWLIDKLKLDKGFKEENIDINIQRTTILSIAIIVIGGLMFIGSLPQLCNNILYYFEATTIFGSHTTSGLRSIPLAKTIIGYLLMTNSKFVVNFIDKHTSKTRDKIE